MPEWPDVTKLWFVVKILPVRAFIFVFRGVSEEIRMMQRLLRATTYRKIRDAGNGSDPKKAATF